MTKALPFLLAALVTLGLLRTAAAQTVTRGVPEACASVQSPRPPRPAVSPARGPGWGAAQEADMPRRGLAGLMDGERWDDARRALFRQIAEPYIQSGGYAPRDDSTSVGGLDVTALLRHAVEGGPGSRVAPPGGTLFSALYTFQTTSRSIPGRTLPDKLSALANERRRAGTEVPAEREKIDAVIGVMSFMAKHYPTLRAMAGNDGYLSAGDIDASFNSLRAQAHGIALSGKNPATGERLPFGGAMLRRRYRRTRENPVVEQKIADAAAGPHDEFRSALVKIGAGQAGDSGPHDPGYNAVQSMGKDLKQLMPVLTKALGGSSGGAGGLGGMLDMSLFVDPQRGIRLAPFETIYAAVMNGTLPTTLELPRPPAIATMAASATAVPGRQVYIAPSGDNYGYLVSLPKDYSPAGKYDVVLSLQGTDMRGKDPSLYRNRGLAGVVDRYRESGVEISSVIVTPVMNDFEVWDPSKINALRDTVVEQYGHADNQVRIVGHSLGGIGTLAAVRANPKGYAAATVISGAIPYQEGVETRFDQASLATWANGFSESQTAVLFVRGGQDSIIPREKMIASERAFTKARPKNTFVHVEPTSGHSPRQLDGDNLLEGGWFGPSAKAAQSAFKSRRRR